MGYLKDKLCYLSGAIDYDSASTNWRTEVIKQLTEKFQIKIFDPFNDPKQSKGPQLKKAKADRNKEVIKEIVGGFVRKDLGMVDRSDFIISRIGFFDVYLPEDIKNFEIDQKYFHEDDGGSILKIEPCKPRRMQIPTTGTIHEIINSDLYHKPTLLVCEEGWWNLPAWLLGFIPEQYWFSSWAELYDYLQKVDSGECKNDDRWHLAYGVV